MKFVKWLLNILGVIFLGVLSTAVWELLLVPGKPKLVRFALLVRDTVLNLPTFGTSILKNSIYRQIPDLLNEQLLRQQPEGLPFLITIAVILAGASALVLILFATGKIEQIIQSFSRETILRLIQRAKSSLGEQDQRSLLKVARYGLFIAIVFMYIAVTVSATSNYIRSAADHYFRVRMIVVPMVTDAQAKTFDSRFAQIASRNDYVDLINEMEAIAKKQGARIPQFHSW